MQDKNEMVLFQSNDGKVTIPVMLDQDTVWLTRLQLAELFDRDVKTIGKHINNALKEEVDSSVVAKFATTAADGKTYQTEHYNLDMIISVGYRVKSQRGVEFRRWANSVLKQYIIQGYKIVPRGCFAYNPSRINVGSVDWQRHEDSPCHDGGAGIRCRTALCEKGRSGMKQLKDKEYEDFQQYLYNKAHGYIWTPDTLELICNGNNGDPERIGKQVLGMAVKIRNEQVAHRLTDKHKTYVIRTLRKNETDLLKDFLYEAIFIPKGAKPPARDIIEKPELRVYTDDFGTRKGDNCLVADFGGKVVGAVWTRVMDDYGHVDDETPSFAISLFKEYRGQGIGSQLMVRMLELLKWQGYEKASLAVQKANYAVKMYENVGFKTVDENAEEYIMVCEL